MKRSLIFALGIFLSAALPIESIHAQGRVGGGGGAGRSGGGGIGGGGGVGGGGIGSRMGGGGSGPSMGGGWRSGGGGQSSSRAAGGGMLGGGGLGGNLGGGASRSAPSLGSGGLGGGGSLRSSPSLGGGSFRSPSNLGGAGSIPSLGSSRSTPSLGAAPRPFTSDGSFIAPSVRPVAPSVNPGRSPGLNFGSSLNRGSDNSAAGSTPGNVLPSIGPQANRTPPQLRLDNSASNNSNGFLRRNNPSEARPNPEGRTTTLRPRTETSGSTSGRSAASLPRASDTAKTTPRSVSNFLSTPGRRNSSPDSTLRQAVSRPVGRNNFTSLNSSQINRINANVNTSFRNRPAIGATSARVNNGFGYGYNHPHWNNWAGGVRGAWNPYHYHNCFTPRFWATNYCNFSWPRSCYWWGSSPWSYWWNAPTWGGLCDWLPSYGWNSPNYYGYGLGGNVVYTGGYVYVNDLPIATAEDYAASAAKIAEVPTPPNPDEPTEWLPLGTFALSAGEDDKDPERVVQLAVDKDGVISGTMTNQKSKQTFPIQGRVDKETQRVAFTIGDAKDVVFETGIFNLTQQQTPILVHGEGREETYLLLRLEQPKDDAVPAVAAPPGAAPATPLPPAPMAP